MRLVKPLFLVCILLLMTFSTIASTVEVKATTPTVKGRAPVAASVVINNLHVTGKFGPLALVGESIEIDYIFSDVDHDQNGGAGYRWLLNGRAVANTRVYVPQYTDVNLDLMVEVTPKS